MSQGRYLRLAAQTAAAAAGVRDVRLWTLLQQESSLWLMLARESSAIDNLVRELQAKNR